jgi:hypothetical protein
VVSKKRKRSSIEREKRGLQSMERKEKEKITTTLENENKEEKEEKINEEKEEKHIRKKQKTKEGTNVSDTTTEEEQAPPKSVYQTGIESVESSIITEHSAKKKAKKTSEKLAQAATEHAEKVLVKKNYRKEKGQKMRAPHLKDAMTRKASVGNKVNVKIDKRDVTDWSSRFDRCCCEGHWSWRLLDCNQTRNPRQGQKTKVK